MQRTSIRLERGLHRQLKHLSIDMGLSFNDVLTKAVMEFLEREASKGKEVPSYAR